MERLKSVLADKIIEISSENGDVTKQLLEKVNRFRDFSFACETLMQKYAGIEDELIRMIGANDFDTRVASTRVNGIIALAEGGAKPETVVAEVPMEADAVVEDVPEETSVLPMAEEAETAETAAPAAPAGETAEPENDKRKKQIRLVFTLLAIGVALVAGYYLYLFVKKNWQTILITLGVIAASGALLWFLANKKKK